MVLENLLNRVGIFAGNVYEIINSPPGYRNMAVVETILRYFNEQRRTIPEEYSNQ